MADARVGLADLKRRLAELLRTRAFDQVMQDAAEEVRKRAVELAPYGDDESRDRKAAAGLFAQPLKETSFVDVRAEGMSIRATIGFNAPHAKLVEFGADGHTIVARQRPHLVFPAREGGLVFTPVVRKLDQPPQAYLFPAAKEVFAKLKAKLGAQVRLILHSPGRFRR